jgi:non-specific serine/threonine protein kinase
MTYYGHTPFSLFEGTAPKRPPAPSPKTPQELLDAIDRRLAASVEEADVVVPIAPPPFLRPVSIVDRLLPDLPPRSSRGPDARWRVAFLVSPRLAGGWRTAGHVGHGLESRAALRAVSQYLRKDGTPGRMEPVRTDVVHAPSGPELQKLLLALAADGGESLLLLHLDRLREHPDLPVYAEGPDGRGSCEHTLSVRMISRIRISFTPVLVDHPDPDTVVLRPRVLVDLHLSGDGEGAAAPGVVTTQEVAWADSLAGRFVGLVGDRWLGWCEGDERLLTLVSDLLEERVELDAADVAVLRDRVLTVNDPLVTVDLPFRSVRMVTRRPRVDLLLHEGGEGVVAMLAFGYADDVPGVVADPAEAVVVRHDTEFEHGIARALKEYFAAGPSKARLLSRYGDEGVTWTFTTSLAGFLADFGETLLSRSLGLCIESTANRLSRSGAKLQIRVSSGIDWFDLSASAGEDLDLSRVDTGDPLFGHGFVRNGDRIIYIGADEAEKLREVLALLDPSQRTPRVSRLDLHGAEVLHGLAAEGAPIELQRTAEIARALATPASLDRVPPPRGFTGKLRDYQLVGYGWLSFLAEHGLNGCLADDMGLGKTVQALAFLQRIAERDGAGPGLVVAPVSTLRNWQAEAARFTPGLRAVVHHGTDRPRDAAAFGTVDLVIVSYATLRVDQELFRSRRWNVVILDEAQGIKNPASQSFGVVKTLESEHRFTLTGTPLENSVIDLWSQVDFLEPGLLGSLQRFRKRFGSAVAGAPDPERDRLRRLVSPFILRRTKEVVERSLPAKEEVVLYAEMGPRQQAAYDALKADFRRRIAGALEAKGIAGCGALIFEGLLRLRQAACFPAQASPSLKNVPSAKLEVLEDLLGEIVAEGHRVLVFSQFVQSLKAIAAAMDARGMRHEYLDGATRDRQDVIDRFQADAGVPLFLLSLKAGGLGINLTAADYVVLFDPWWNPAVERQAVDRSHRIGQRKPVFVYRLVTRDSIEERILELQEKKRALAAELIEENPRSLLALDETELMGLFS